MSTTPPITPPEYGATPTAPDARTKGIAWTALALAIAGIIAALVGLIPILWVGFGFALLACLLLLAAFVFSLIGLIGKRNGGKGISVTALILSIVGGVIASFALVISLVLFGPAASGNSSAPAPEASAAPSAEPSDDSAVVSPTDEATPAAPDADATAAFLADVRPKVNDLMASVDPTITPEIVESVFPDDQLVLMGQTLLIAGEGGIDAIVDATVAQSGDVVPADILRQLYQSVLESAQNHLQ
ncbi:hypothetical protein [uncultured Microbacterium sp.]|uniref:hypothetical protein n=1 Tax=uncultured Microbacterium sp. TaxID=191216 RepID=UPI0026254752|nr:hypothetical protein [uncultured Microbacterium sp.]